MDKTQVQDRIKQLETEREQMRLNLSAYDGAIQDCQYWLERMDNVENNANEPSQPTE